MRRLCMLPLALVLCLASSLVRAEDIKGSQARWPQFRGPAGQGIGVEGLRLPSQFGPTKNLVWKTALQPGHSSPCIWDDRIFTTGFDSQAKKLETICLDRTSGKVLWRRAAPAQKIEHVHELNTPASSTPASDGEHVYVYIGSYGLLCYGRDGDLKWQRPLDPIVTPFGSGTSPVVAGNLVLLNSGKGGTTLTLLALDRTKGTTV